MVLLLFPSVPSPPVLKCAINILSSLRVEAMLTLMDSSLCRMMPCTFALTAMIKFRATVWGNAQQSLCAEWANVYRGPSSVCCDDKIPEWSIGRNRPHITVFSSLKQHFLPQ